MKKLEELNKSKSPNVIINKRLEKYDSMPLFQDKLDKANAILAESNPLVFLRELDNKQIKHLFEQNMPIEQIAKQMRLLQAEVLVRLQEMGLIETNACV